jgi:hypothetical protein
MLSVLLIDIDHFKVSTTDALGHQAGDACLQRIAQVIDGSTSDTSGPSGQGTMAKSSPLFCPASPRSRPTVGFQAAPNRRRAGACGTGG